MSSLNHYEIKTIRLSGERRKDLNVAAEILVQGGIVALPTETVYGLAANGLSISAIQKIYEAKNRPEKNPLIFHVKDMEQAQSLFAIETFSPRTMKRFSLLCQHYWPGPLTIIAKKAHHVPHLATGGLETVAVRMPKHEATLAILEMIEFPLVMPSANLSTRPSSTSMEHVLMTLDGRIDAVVDGGKCEMGIESTVIKIDDEVPTILRHGMINAELIENCLSETLLLAHEKPSSEPLSPGQSYLHYAPLMASVEICTADDAHNFWHHDAIMLGTKNDHDDLKQRLGPRPHEVQDILLSSDKNHFASELYQALYLCEKSPNKRLIIMVPSNASREWLGILDRLYRSAGKPPAI